MEKHSSNVVRTAEVIGRDVIGSDNKKLGIVEEIVLDKLNGSVRYAVLSFGGFMGIGDELYALPWETLEYCNEEDSFKINFDKEKLKSASGFDKNIWPDFADKQLEKSLRNYYGLENHNI